MADLGGGVPQRVAGLSCRVLLICVLTLSNLLLDDLECVVSSVSFMLAIRCPTTRVTPGAIRSISFVLGLDVVAVWLAVLRSVALALFQCQSL